MIKNNITNYMKCFYCSENNSANLVKCSSCKEQFCFYHHSNHKHGYIHICMFCSNDATSKCLTCTEHFCDSCFNKHRDIPLCNLRNCDRPAMSSMSSIDRCTYHG